MFSRYTDTSRTLPKTLLLVGHQESACCPAIISQLQQTRPEQQPSFFHVSYTYASIDEQIINIYTVGVSSSVPDGLVKDVDLAVYILDYERDPHGWIDTLSRPMPTSKNTLVVVCSRENASRDLDQETHEYIQLALRSVCLKEGYSLLYSSDSVKISKVVKKMLLSLDSPKFSSQDYRELFFFQGTDTWTKISAIGGDLTAEELQEKCAQWRVDGFGDYDRRVPSRSTPTKKELETHGARGTVPLDEFLMSLA